MNLYIEGITILAEVLLFWFFFSKHFFENTLKTQNSIIFLFIYTIILCLGTFYLPLIPRLSILFLCILLGNYFVFQIKTLKVIYLTILFFASSALSDILCGAFLTSVWHLELQKLTSDTRFYLIYYSVAKLIHLIILLIINRLFSIRNSNRSILSSFPLILCHAVSIFIFHLVYRYHCLNGDSFLITISTIALLYINIVLCFYVEYLFHHQEERERLLVAEQQLVMNERFYADMLQRQEETRSLWHDIKKYVLAVECLVSESNSSEAKTQSQKVLDAFHQIQYTVDSGNTIIDGILNHELLYAKQHNIEFDLNLWISSSFSIDATDLYVILGNTIDNAIEACINLPSDSDKKIKITLKQKGSLLLYEISNPYQDSAQKTQKTQKKFHGYGLQNVKNVLTITMEL